MMMMMMRRVLCVLAVVLCCACGYTMTAAAAAVDNDSPSGRGVSRGAVEVSCGAGGALRVRLAAESEWLTCGAGSRVSACGKYADLCRQRTARAATTTTTIATINAGQPKAVMAFYESNKLWGGVDSVKPTVYHPGVTDTDIIKNRPEEPTVDTQCKKPQEGKLQKNPTEPEPPRGDAVAMGDAGPAKVTDAPKTLVPEEKVPDAAPAPGSEPTSVEDSVMKSEGVQNLVTHTDVGQDLPQQHEHPPSDDRRDPTIANNDTTKEKSSNSTDGDNENVPTTNGSLPDGTEAVGSTSSTGDLDSQVTASATSDRHSAEGVDSNQEKPQPQSENTIQSLQETNSTTTPSPENTTPVDHNTSQQPSSATVDVTAASNSQDPNTTIPATTTNTTTEAPTNTPSPVPNSEINKIAPTMQMKTNVDSSVNPVWMRTAAPLLIVVVLFSVTVY